MTNKEKEKKVNEQKTAVDKKQKDKEAAAPTITMQGVSGRKITGVVKVVKAKKVEKPEPIPVVSTDQEKVSVQMESDAVSSVEKKVDTPAQEVTATAATPTSAAGKTDTVAPTLAASKDKKPAASVAAEPVTTTAQGQKPRTKTPIRPQRGRYIEDPSAARAQAPIRPQQGSYVRNKPGEVVDKPRTERPLSSYSSDRPGPGQHDGRRTGKPFGRPQGSQGGTGTGRTWQQGGRPQGAQGGFYKDKDDDIYQSNGARSQSRRPKKTGIPGVPEELREVITQTKSSSFAAREAYHRDNKRDDKKDMPKPGRIAAAADTKDRQRAIRQQTAALSGRSVHNLNEETLLDTIYKGPPRGRGRGRNRRKDQRTSAPVVRAVLTHVKLPDSLTVKEFAEAIKKTSAEVIKHLMKMGVMATLNQEIDFDTAEIIASEFGITCEKLIEVTEEDILFDDTEDDAEDLKPRPPVVVVMGHVDHGKTSILDRIRSASVAKGEAGGITQHIGAYTVRLDDRRITFLDTPGHEAFTTMRARGAQVTDIAILVVAADDGVMPQTVEAINHARAANTEIIVAINKIDKEGANIDRVKQELANYELISEEWGGQTVMVPVSALKGENIGELLEMVLLTADVMDLKANPNKQAKGTVIEAKLDRSRGPVATVLVQRGTLRTGDTLVTGSIIGHVRAMTDDRGNQVKKAGPSIPVEILGLPEVPEAGDVFYAVTDDKVARSLADRRRSQQREQQLRASSRMSLDTLFTQMEAGEVKDLNIIVKADVQGSVEAVRQSLEKLNDNKKQEVRVNVIHGAVGAITESDVRLAEVSNAIVIGFNVRPAVKVADMAKEVGVDLRMYRVIYSAIEDIEAAMKGMLAPQYEEHVLGHAEIRQTFKVSGIGTIAGCYVTDGKIMRSNEVRIVRDGVVIHEGKLSSLKRFKDDAREVASGYECGICLERFNDLKESDVIEAFEMREIERS